MRRALLAVVAVAALACDHRTPESESSTWRSSLAPGRAIRIRNLNGPIRVQPTEGGPVEVTAVKHYEGSRPQAVRFVTGTDGDGAFVCAVWGGGTSCDKQRSDRSHRSVWARILGHGGGVEVEFSVLVPPGVRVDVGTTNGDVRVEGVTGATTARTVNGNVRVAGASGPVDAATVNGSVTTSVDHYDPSQPLALKTVNGSVTAELPEGVDATVEMSTVNGRVNAEFPVTVQGAVSPKRLRGIIGGGGGEIRLETVNGGVTLKRRGASTS